MIDLTATDPMTLEELIQALANFSGTEKYHRHGDHVLLTDGVKFLAEKGGCSWLMDCIAAVQTITFLKKAGGLQTWTVTVRPDNSATIICVAGEKKIHREEIEQTDFILGRAAPFTLFADLTTDRHSLVIYLPGER